MKYSIHQNISHYSMDTFIKYYEVFTYLQRKEYIEDLKWLHDYDNDYPSEYLIDWTEEEKEWEDEDINQLSLEYQKDWEDEQYRGDWISRLTPREYSKYVDYMYSFDPDYLPDPYESMEEIMELDVEELIF